MSILWQRNHGIEGDHFASSRASSPSTAELTGTGLSNDADCTHPASNRSSMHTSLYDNTHHSPIHVAGFATFWHLRANIYPF